MLGNLAREFLYLLVVCLNWEVMESNTDKQTIQNASRVNLNFGAASIKLYTLPLLRVVFGNGGDGRYSQRAP